MPFCINCGTFESMLKPRDLCQSCFGSLKETEFIKDEIESKRKNIKTELNYPILSYLHDLFPHQKYAGRQTGGIFGFLENLAQNNNPPPPINRQHTQMQNDVDIASSTYFREEGASSNLGRNQSNPYQDYQRSMQPPPDLRVNRTYRGNGGNGNRNSYGRTQMRRNSPRAMGPPNQIRRPVGFQHYMKSNIALILLVIAFFVPTFAVSIPLEIVALVLGILAKRDEPRSWRIAFAILGSGFLLLLDVFALLFGDMILDMYEQQMELAESPSLDGNLSIGIF